MTNNILWIIALLGIGCTSENEIQNKTSIESYEEESEEIEFGQLYNFDENNHNFYETPSDNSFCHDGIVSAEAVEKIIDLSNLTNEETIYTIYDRIDNIAFLFEDCNDPWGMFPTTYRHITNRIIEAIENNEIEDTDWAKKIVVDFASRYMYNLNLILHGESPSYAWNHYYYLADNPDVSRTRAVVIAMVAHLTLDLPYSLVAIDTTEDHKDDYFCF